MLLFCLLFRDEKCSVVMWDTELPETTLPSAIEVTRVHPAPRKISCLQHSLPLFSLSVSCTYLCTKTTYISVLKGFMHTNEQYSLQGKSLPMDCFSYVDIYYIIIYLLFYYSG